MEELRWILLGIGLLILAGIYFFADPSERRGDRPARDAGDSRPAPRRTASADDPPEEAMEQELRRLGKLISEERSGDAPVTEEHEGLVSPEPERIVVLFLRASGGAMLSGPDIVDAAEKVGLEWGDLQIFHRMHESSDERVAVFSLADMMQPGSFDRHKLDEIRTHGLCLFMTLPNSLTALDAWDAMLAAGQRLADILDAELLDEAHSSLSRQRIAHIREEMRDYDRRRELMSDPR